jgi:hypothetical protein
VKNKNGSELRPVNNGSATKGGLSHANGNCLMVTRTDDDRWEITDSKLGDESPTWSLSSDQFHALGRAFVCEIGWPARSLRYDLGDGLVYTQTALPNLERPGFNPNMYECELTGFEPMRFTFSEMQAFQWGYFNGQFPQNGPVQQLVFTV